MIPLETIPSFPKKVSATLKKKYGIDTAESFYTHAIQDKVGLSQALHLSENRLEKLASLVAQHLPETFLEKTKRPLRKRPLGLIGERN